MNMIAIGHTNGTLPVPEALNNVTLADGLRDMQGLAARFSAAAAQWSPE